MEGVDPRHAWSSYLHLEDDYSDALCAATLTWIRQTLVQQALASNQPGLIGLFRRDPRQVKGSTAPTLAEFAARFADAGDFSEAELTEMWKDEYGGRSTKAEERRTRLAKRLREALQLMERAVKRTPAAGDSVALWLSPRLAERLQAAGLATLAEVAASLRARPGARWEAVPGVGEVGAARIAAWLAETGLEGLGEAGRPALPAPAIAPLVPLELVPDAGPRTAPALPSGGRMAPANTLGARSDKHAIELWLNAKARNPNTLRSYRKNGERLLLWCMYEARISLAEMTVADCINYREWLSQLGSKTAEEWSEAGWRIPAEQWFCKRGTRRDSPDWRPFEGRLSDDSVRQEMLVIRSLFSFLNDGGYIPSQPWRSVGKPARSSTTRLRDAAEQFVDRSLDKDQWAHLIAGIDPSAGDIEARLNFVLWLGFGCGLRASEMLSLTFESIVPRTSGWRLRVLGKGNKVRTIPLPSPTRHALLQYMQHLGIEASEVARLAQEDVREPLLRAARGRRSADRPAPSAPLSYTQLYRELKRHLAARAAALPHLDPRSATFQAASTHWLRHTFATLALRSGVPLNSVQRVLGHKSLSTTTVYVTADADELQADVEQFVAGAGR